MNRASKKGGLGRARWRRTLAGLFLVGCGGAVGVPQTGGESHFLAYCDASSCGDGLSCIAGVCTRGCVVAEEEQAKCTDLAEAATCTDQSIEPGAVAVCDVACAGDDECSALGKAHRCEAGFCRAGTSSAPGPSDHPLVFPCPPGNIGGDAFDYLRHRYNGDLLEIEIAHGGGCAEHEYSLCYGPGFLESDPVQTTLTLLHDANGDTCDAYLRATLTFDLSPLAAAYEAGYQSDGGLIQTNYSLYAFGALSCEQRTTAAHSQMSDAAQWSSTCATDADCTTGWMDVSCAHSCSTGLASASEGDFQESLGFIEGAICGDFDDVCPPDPVPPCVPPPPPACVNGRCQ